MTETQPTPQPPAGPARRSLSPRARWAVPAVAAVAVGAAVLAPPLLASADDQGLPPVTPEELVAQVAGAEAPALSGTIVYTARLGLPSLPFGTAAGADPVNLMSGSSTLRVWTDGETRSRVALLGAASEYSVVHDAAQAWTYSSDDDEVVHYTLDAADVARLQELEKSGPPVQGDLPTPQAAADAALAHAQELSTVSLDGVTTVAGRDAYQLVVTPKSTTTLVGRTVLAVDAETSTPLRVQVWSAQDDTEPALEVGFTDVTFATPTDAVLTFSPPAGAQVREVVVPLPTDAELAGAAQEKTDGTLPAGVTVHGEGWDTVVEVADVDVAGLVAGDPEALGDLAQHEPTIGSDSAQALLEDFGRDPSQGAPGELDPTALFDAITTAVPEGRLISSDLFSVLITDDGRLLLGAVSPQTLQGLA
ncbi:LolA family protein [Cellulomonas biazotea]|uniref:LolA family protein n=1 Tax=Cellulomonas biazotea TaxID=1709 RepID=UPI0035EFC4BA